MMKRNKRKNEKGSALIIVLGVVSLFGIIAASVMSSGYVSRVNSHVYETRSQARYAAESAYADTIWKLATQRFGVVADAEEGEETDENLWTADGRIRHMEIDDYRIELRILDANTGLPVTGKRPGSDLKRRVKLEQDVLYDQMDDYVDADDLPKLHGMEQAQYEVMTLPRNDVFQMREELYFLPELREHISGRGYRIEYFQMIPPSGSSLPQKPAFFSSTDRTVQEVGRFTDDDMTLITEAKTEFYEKQADLGQTLGELHRRIQSRFEFNETGVFVIDIRAVHSSGINRRFWTCIDLRRLSPSQARPMDIWQRKVF